jgi:hypothetical protein
MPRGYKLLNYPHGVVTGTRYSPKLFAAIGGGHFNHRHAGESICHLANMAPETGRFLGARAATIKLTHYPNSEVAASVLIGQLSFSIEVFALDGSIEPAGRFSPLGPLGGIGIILPVTGSRCGYCQGIDRRHYANN